MCFWFTKKSRGRANLEKINGKNASLNLGDSDAKNSQNGRGSAETLTSRKSAEHVSSHTDKNLSLEQTQPGSDDVRNRGNSCSGKQAKLHPKKYCREEDQLTSESSASDFPKRRPVARVASNEIIHTTINDPTISGHDFTESTQGKSAYGQNVSKSQSLKNPPIAKKEETDDKKSLMFKKSHTFELKEESARDDSPEASGSANVSFRGSNLSASAENSASATSTQLTQNSVSPSAKTCNSGSGKD